MRAFFATILALFLAPAMAIDESFSPPEVDSVLFRYDSTEFASDGPGVYVQEHDRVVIEAHTDCDGSNEYNDALSQRRAEAVAVWLGAEDYEVRAYGESMPLAGTPCLPRQIDHNQPLRRATVIVECGIVEFPCTAAPPDSWLPDETRPTVITDVGRFH